MPELKVHSRRDPLPKELLYPLKTGELGAALQPKLTRDVHLSVSFNRQQAYWKEDRDRIEEKGRYTLARCTYYASGRHIPQLSSSPWSGEERPQVVTATVVAIPRAVLRKGASIHAVTADLVRQAVAVLAPKGIPSPPKRGDKADDAWYFVLELDSTIHRVLAMLHPWEGGAFGLRTLERELIPARVGGPDTEVGPPQADQDRT